MVSITNERRDSKSTAGIDTTSNLKVSETPANSLHAEALTLTENVGFHRASVDGLSKDAAELHQNSWDIELRARTFERVKESPEEMLGMCADLGFAWRDLARMLNVSVAGVQKWRKGEKASGVNLKNIAKLIATIDMIREHYQIFDIASWFEVPIVDDASVTAIDMYAAGRTDLVLELANGGTDPEIVMSGFDPKWREAHRSNFEVFEASDGNLSIRSKG